ncbi:MAG TPA: phosphoglucomutase (alpha-D-glucose-1,6-bisphosphate-dependent) [Candidatus Cryosericum sp.]|nr:phosphoglucomutase (alpha-D-glucose-1,6-bisphosphate-dependent) [Candidatus Cryosericum sp.]
MPTHPLAGKPAPPDLLIDPAALERAYYEGRPDVSDPLQRVSFGTSGHRGTPLEGSFTEAHVLAMTQAICEFRRSRGIDGPLFVGKDTHAVSAPAERTALEVLAANGVETIIQIVPGGGSTGGGDRRARAVIPTPVVSRAILAHNRARASGTADGIVITPSHNPPSDGGFKYNPPHGGPADTDVTDWIQERANDLLRDGNRGVLRVDWEAALRAPTTREQDLIRPYVRDLKEVLDMEAIRAAGLHIGVDPLGGAGIDCWSAVREEYGIDLTVVNETVDPTFRFMSVDHDGRIRMDCSSPYAMAGLVRLKDRFDVAWGNDADADRHGIVTPSAGLLNPNHYLAVSIAYLLRTRGRWASSAVVGKTLVTSGLVDRVVADLGRRLFEVPVGFKWFTSGLHDGTCCFGGEESAGASFLRRDGAAWTTDKDGLLLGLLAAEMTATTGKDPGVHYRELAGRLGAPHYTRIDAPATLEQKDLLKRLAPEAVAGTDLAGEPIQAKLTRAPGNGAPIGGLKVVAASGWFAARPSGTENVYKLYAESFRSQDHLRAILDQARGMLSEVFGGR